jgi:hypothetical protein
MKEDARLRQPWMKSVFEIVVDVFFGWRFDRKEQPKELRWVPAIGLAAGWRASSESCERGEEVE